MLSLDSASRAADEAFDAMIASGQLPDDAIGNELRYFGPPGTGKTTTLSAHINQAAQRFGLKGVLVMSHTRAAARELAGRKVALSSKNVATLHSICYQALQKPKIAETLLERWNDREPNWKIVGRSQDADCNTLEGPGDRALRAANAYRAALIPPDRWHIRTRQFWAAWQKFKRAERALDFTDMIEQALRDVPIAPGNPRCIIIDEAQDLTPLQLLLVRSWAKTCDYIVLAGDDEQALYDYAGASPSSLLYPRLMPSQIRILRQSYRVPGAVHEYALRQWVSRLTVRQAKTFLPRTEKGCVTRVAAGAFDALRLVNRIEAKLASLQTPDETCMVLASANFALKNVLAELRRQGIPFFNPYRSEAQNWNPLGPSNHGAGARLEALLAARGDGRHYDRLWTGAELKRWASWIADEAFLPEQRLRLVNAESEHYYGAEYVAGRLRPGHWAGLRDRLQHSDAALADWWRKHVEREHIGEARYAATVVAQHQAAALARKPQLIVGTIHSVKGAGADVVFLLPDLTNRWRADWIAGGARRDALIRMYYVASTRTKRELILLQPWRRGSAVELGHGAYGGIQ